MLNSDENFSPVYQGKLFARGVLGPVLVVDMGFRGSELCNGAAYGTRLGAADSTVDNKGGYSSLRSLPSSAAKRTRQ